MHGDIENAWSRTSICAKWTNEPLKFILRIFGVSIEVRSKEITDPSR